MHFSQKINNMHFYRATVPTIYSFNRPEKKPTSIFSNILTTRETTETNNQSQPFNSLAVAAAVTRHSQRTIDAACKRRKGKVMNSIRLTQSQKNRITSRIAQINKQINTDHVDYVTSTLADFATRMHCGFFQIYGLIRKRKLKIN